MTAVLCPSGKYGRTWLSNKSSRKKAEKATPSLSRLVGSTGFSFMKTRKRER